MQALETKGGTTPNHDTLIFGKSPHASIKKRDLWFV